MAVITTLVAKLIADVGGFREEMESAGDTIKGVGKDMGQVGGDLTSKMTLPIVGAGTAAVLMSNKFNSGMANVASLVPESSSQILAMSDDVQQLAVDVGQSTGDMTQGLYQVVSAFGYSGDAMDQLRINAVAAKAGLASTEEAIALTSAVTKGYGDTSATATQKAADLALRTVQLGQTTFPELAASIGRVVPLAGQLGVKQEELFGVMATATGVTGGAAEVSTQLRGVLQSLMAPTETMSALIKQQGYESGTAMLQHEGLQRTIALITQAATTSNTPLQSYIGSIEGQTLAMALAGPLAEQMAQKTDAMTKAAGTAQGAFAIQTQGVNAAGFAMQQAGIQIQTTGESLGNALGPAILQITPYVTQLVGWITGLVDRFTQLDPKTQAIILGAVGLAAAIGPILMVLGPIVTGFGALVTVLGAILSPVGLVIAAIAGLIAIGILVYKHWDEIKAWLQNLWNNLVAAVTAKVEEMRTAISTWWDGVVAWFKGLPEQAAQLGRDIIQGVINGIAERAEDIKSFISDLFGDVINIAKRILGIKSPSAVFASVGENIGLGLAAGVERSTPAALRSVDRMMSRVGSATPALSVALDQAGSRRGAAPAGWNVTIHVHANGDPQAIGRATEQGVLRARRALGYG